MRYWGPLAVLLVLLLAAEQGGAAEVRTVLGLAHDSNLYEAEASPQSGWVSRLYVVSSGTLLRHRSGSLRIEYRGGIKRFWQAERSSTEGAGEVVANQALVSGAFRVHQRVVLSGSGELKLKNVNRVPGEEAYLRGAFESRLNASVGRGFEGGAHYRLGADDSRDVLLPEVILKELGMEAQYRRSRAFRARLHAAWRWLDYDRDALTVGPGGGNFTGRCEPVRSAERVFSWNPGVPRDAGGLEVRLSGQPIEQLWIWIYRPPSPGNGYPASCGRARWAGVRQRSVSRVR